MSLYKFEPSEDITVQELALIVKTFLLAIHQEGPTKNLEVMEDLVEFFISKNPSIIRHFQEVSDYD
ncbi:MAG: hypothetical protein M0R77_02835 [Gammaproteobacteria bacterium]|nr:hypothetical protein [Gammaproteobacteria bacterium]